MGFEEGILKATVVAFQVPPRDASLGLPARFLLKSAVRLDRSTAIYLNFKYLDLFFTQMLGKCSIFTDDIEIAIHQYKSIRLS